MDDLAARNKRRAVSIVSVFALVIGLVVFAVLALFGLGLVGLGIAVVVAVGATLVAYQRSGATVLRLAAAEPADPTTYPRLHNLVEGLCVASGLPKPDLYVIDDDAPNAFAVGRSPRHAAVAVTTGMLDRLDRMELEAVLAHELSHIKNHDTEVSTLAVTMVGTATPFLLPVALGGERESSADGSAIEITRFPPALISALETLRDNTSVVRVGSRAMAHLWIEAPVETHPPIEQRIDTLREL